ncbi:MAG TPA: histidine kinase [Opitutaceae bacterium]|nr:histidine kinase [Opitutaceae bacterium]HND62761.1 histidine kinase [Opitutaceae bacterium]
MPESTLRARIAVWKARMSDRVIARLMKVPAGGPFRALATILAMLFVVGVIDYSIGPRASVTLLYVIPIALSVAWLGARAGSGIAAVAVLARVAGDLSWGPYEYPEAATWNRFTDLSIYLAMVWALDALLNSQRRLEDRVADRTRELQQAVADRRQLERELLQISSRERNLLGQEIHDDICQHLVGTALSAKVLASHLKGRDPTGAANAEAIVGLIETGAEKSRRLARGLLLGAIEPELLPEKLAEMVEEAGRGGLACRFRHDGRTLVSDAGVAAQLFRIAEEAVRNAGRHAQAQLVQVTLETRGDTILLEVHDDGRGLGPEAPEEDRMGLRIMSNRAAFIGGTLAIRSELGRGTRVVCELPRLSTS